VSCGQVPGLSSRIVASQSNLVSGLFLLGLPFCVAVAHTSPAWRSLEMSVDVQGLRSGQNPPAEILLSRNSATKFWGSRQLIGRLGRRPPQVAAAGNRFVIRCRQPEERTNPVIRFAPFPWCGVVSSPKLGRVSLQGVRSWILVAPNAKRLPTGTPRTASINPRSLIPPNRTHSRRRPRPEPERGRPRT
jgi:hypothetical protein